MPFDGQRKITIQGLLSPSLGQPWSVPQLKLNDVTTHTGVLLVWAPEQLRLRTLEQTHVRTVTAPEALAKEVEGPPSLAFEVWRDDFTLTFQTSLKESSLQAAMTNILLIEERGLELHSTITIQPQRDALFEVRLRLPTDYHVIDVSKDANPVEWERLPADAGLQDIRVVLPNPVRAGESVTLNLQSEYEPESWPIQQTPASVPLPAVKLLQAGMVEVLYGICAPEVLEVSPVDITGIDPASRAEMESLNSRLTKEGKQLRLGFAGQDLAYQGQLQISRRPGGLSVETISLFHVDRETVTTQLESRLSVSGGGMRTFNIQLSAAAGDQLRFTLIPVNPQSEHIAQLMEQIPGEPMDGMRPWVLSCDRPLRGDYLLRTIASQPRGTGTEFSPVEIRFPQAISQSGFIAVVGSEDEQVKITDKGADDKPLQVVDPIDFPLAREWSQRRVIAGYRFSQPGWTLQTTVSQFSRGAIPPAIGHHLKMTSVWKEGTDVQNLGELTFNAVGMQSLSVKLPENARLWSVLLDSQPVESRHGADRINIPLSQLDPQQEHRLVLLYDTASPAGTNETRLKETTFQSVPPQFTVTTGSGGEQPLPVLQQTWDVHHPDTLMILKAAAPYQSAEPLPVRAWRDRIRELIGSVTPWQIIVGIIILAVAFAIYYMLNWAIHDPKERMAGIVVVCLTAIVLGVLLLPATQQAREAAHRSELRHQQKQRELDEMNRLEMESPPSVTAIPPFGSTDPKFGEPASQSKSEVAPPPTSAPPAPASNFMLSQAAPQQQAKPQEPQLPPQGETREEAIPPVQLGITPVRRAVQQKGLLSLAAELHIPANTQHQQFTYQGNRLPGSDVSLKLKTASRTTACMIQAAIALGILFLGWLLRNASPKRVSCWLFLTVVLPLALLGFAAGWGSVVITGVLLGGLLSIGVWTLYTFGNVLERIRLRLWECCTHRTAARLILLAVLLNGTVNGTAVTQAADTKPAPAPAPAAGTPYVVVPYQSLEKISSADRVYVPPELFRQLWKASHPDDFPTTDPAVPALIAEAIYRAEPVITDSGSRLRIDARWVIVNQSNSPQTVVLPVKGISLEEARVGDKAAPLTVNSEGVPSIILAERGVQIVDARFSLAVEATPDAGQFTLDLAPVGAGVLTLVLPVPKESRRIRVNSGTTRFQKVDQDDRQEIQIPIDRGGRLSVAWQPERQQQDNDSLLQLAGQLAVTVTDVGLNHVQNFKLTVRQGATSECRFELPKGLAIRRLHGIDVAGWELGEEEDGKQPLKVIFRRQITDETSFNVDLFQPIDPKESTQSFSLLLLNPLGMNRETGVVGVAAPAELQLSVTSTEGLQRIDTKDFPVQAFTLPKRDHSIHCYRYAARPIAMGLKLERRFGETQANAYQGVRVGLRKISVASSIHYQVSRSPQRLFEIELPEDYQAMDVICGDSVDWFISRVNDRRILTVELAQPKTGQIEIGLEGYFTRTSAPQPLSLAVPIPIADKQTTHLGVWFDAAEQGTLTDAGKWVAIAPNELPVPIRKLSPELPQFAYRLTNDKSPLVFDVRKNLPELNADAAILIAVGDATVDYGFTFRWTVTNSATDTFAVTTPNWLGQLEFQAEGIRQIRSEPAEQGRTRWILTSLEPVRDQFLVTAAAMVALPGDQIIQAPQLYFLSMTGPNPFAELQQQRQFAVLVNLSSNQLSPSDSGKIETVAVGDLPLKLPEELVRQAMDIVRVREGNVPTWNVQRPERIESARAVVLSATLTTVLQQDGSWRTKAVYGVRNRGQQFLALQIPENAEILSVLVRNLPSRTVLTTIDEKPVQLVPLPQTSAADLSFDVTLIFSGQLPHALPKAGNWWGRSISIPAPNILSPKDSTEFGVLTAQTLWNVYVPEGLSATPTTRQGNTNVTWHQGSGWLEAELQTLSRFRSDLNELSRILSSSEYSYSQRSQARSNLKQLQSKLESQQSFATSGRSLGDASDRLYEENQQLLNEAAESARKGSDLPVEVPDQLKTEVGNRAFIYLNNGIVSESNTITPARKANQTPTSGFEFYSQNDQRRSGSKQQAQEVQERSKLKSQLQQQAPLNISRGISSREGEAAGAMGGMGSGRREMKPASPQSPGEPIVGRILNNQSQFLPDVDAPFRQGSFDLAAPTFGGQEFRIRENLNGMIIDESGIRDQSGLFDKDQQQAAVPRWTATGGLSVPVTLPVAGNELAFSRVGGSPELTLTIRGADWRGTLRSLLWGGLWLAVGLILLKAKPTAATSFSAVQIGLLLLVLIGLIGFLLVPGEERWPFFLLLIAAGFLRLLFNTLPRWTTAGN
ncbi:MAG TPA: hypothetical protein VNQ76_11205 [Planctomicrobium sp.]|nr:hypothetical protein [Planctomicrobium sp.]